MRVQQLSTGSPATGHNASEPRFNYVNSYPFASMKYGISSGAPVLQRRPSSPSRLRPQCGLKPRSGRVLLRHSRRNTLRP
jgi:hypothetical protein